MIESIKLIPNPVANDFSLTGSFSYVQNIIILDLNGKNVLEIKNISKDEKVNIGHLENGMYQLSIVLDNGESKVMKLVKI